MLHQKSDTKPAVRPAHGLVMFFAVLSLFLVGFNFLLDIQRRMDFEAERKGFEGLIDKEQKAFEKALLVSSDNAGTEAKLSQYHEEFKDLLSSLADLIVESLPKSAGAEGSLEDFSGRETAERGGGIGGENHDISPPGRLSLKTVFDAPLEAILEEFKAAAAEESFRRAVVSELPQPPKWDEEAIINRFLSHYGVELEGGELTRLRNQITVYRYACYSAKNKYNMTLHESLIERIANEDYLSADETGEFVDDGDLRSTVAKKMIGGKLFIWTQESDPELYRLSLVVQYLPWLMLKDIEAFFQERSSR